MADENTLRVSQSYGRSAVHLNGVDISDAVRGVTLKVDCNHLPVAELDVVVFEMDGEVDGADVVIHVPERTRRLLVTLGWTPPEEG